MLTSLETVSVSEGKRALAAVFAVAQRQSESQKINAFIADCIRLASSDLFAVRLYRYLTIDAASNKVLRNLTNIDKHEIANAFIGRMNSHYGDAIDVTSVNLSKSHLLAFIEWSAIDGERDKVVNFWARFIGQSRSRLAEAFDFMVPAGVVWTQGSDRVASASNTTRDSGNVVCETCLGLST